MWRIDITGILTHHTLPDDHRVSKQPLQKPQRVHVEIVTVVYLNRKSVIIYGSFDLWVTPDKFFESRVFIKTGLAGLASLVCVEI